jgi:hypothetical protein
MRTFNCIFRSIGSALVVTIAFLLSSCQVETDEDLFANSKVDDKVEIITLPNGLVLEKVDDYYLFQGDIMYRECDLEELGKLNTRSAIYTQSGTSWPNGEIPYTIESGFTLNAELQQAIEHYYENTPIKWVPKTNQRNSVRFVMNNSNVSSSYLGMIGGEQIISLSILSSSGVIIHEMGHAIGLFHEMSRADRDNYITINWNNIPSDYNTRYQFQTYIQHNEQGSDHGPFDLGSIMMYSPYSYAIDPSIPTITKKDGSLYTLNRTHLSVGDINGIQQLYPLAPFLSVSFVPPSVMPSEGGEGYYVYKFIHVGGPTVISANYSFFVTGNNGAYISRTWAEPDYMGRLVDCVEIFFPWNAWGPIEIQAFFYVRGYPKPWGNDYWFEVFY